MSRPSDGLAAKAAAAGAFTDLPLGLGAIALLVGGVGVANTMVISALERRGEIGLRRSLGAARGQIRLQFLTESLLLSGLGGLVGAAAAAVVTTAYATTQHLPPVIPPWTLGGGLAATLLIGALAGLNPPCAPPAFPRPRREAGGCAVRSRSARGVRPPHIDDGQGCTRASR
ncbi:ABC transporter permease [Actinomadura sp. KC06]|uniref:ABC transporter permease n=1 Tax=Actinomadura sp. KC06 TaxID=2530369 RepID=UPI001FB7C7B0|nr:ABC transporter permease [Actinomadura sp. KC06]